jgi:hypothetical protein
VVHENCKVEYSNRQGHKERQEEKIGEKLSMVLIQSFFLGALGDLGGSFSIPPKREKLLA